MTETLIRRGRELASNLANRGRGSEGALVDDLADALQATRDTEDTNVGAVIARLRERSRKGIDEYGLTTDKAELTKAEWLRHLQDELLDATVYIEAATRDAPGVVLEEEQICSVKRCDSNRRLFDEIGCGYDWCPFKAGAQDMEADRDLTEEWANKARKCWPNEVGYDPDRDEVVELAPAPKEGERHKAPDPTGRYRLRRVTAEVSMDGAWLVTDQGVFMTSRDAAVRIATALSREKELEEALRPFASFAKSNVDDDGWKNNGIHRGRIVDWFGPSDFRAARAVLKEKE